MAVKLYTEDGGLDYEGLADVLKGASNLTNDAQRARTVDVVSAAALVDIASTLNGIFGHLLVQSGAVTIEADTAGEEREDLVANGPLEVGEWVTLADLPENDDEPIRYRVIGVGMSEGEPWAELEGDGVATVRIWQSDLVRVDLPEGLDSEAELEAAEPDEDEGVDLDEENRQMAERAARDMEAFAEQDRQAQAIEAGADPADVIPALRDEQATMADGYADIDADFDEPEAEAKPGKKKGKGKK